MEKDPMPFLVELRKVALKVPSEAYPELNAAGLPEGHRQDSTLVSLLLLLLLLLP